MVNSGKQRWTALVESKIGSADLKQEQIEEYLYLAKEHKIDALITISNQFATVPTHHPIKVHKNKTKHVELYHFSWTSLKSEAVLLSANQQIEDSEQAYILSELVRYLSHDSSGVADLNKMHSDWKEVCSSIQHSATITKTSNSTGNTVASWQQLQRHLALSLSMNIGSPVKISLSRARAKDPEVNFKEDCALLVKNNALISEFIISNAAGKLSFFADFLRRTITFGMKLDAPEDKSKASTAINWLTRQLKSANPETIGIRAYWPKRIVMTSAKLLDVIENPSVLIPENVKDLPASFEVVRIIDLAARFKGTKTFVEDSSKEFPLFYLDVGQNLTKWVAKAPKVKTVEAEPSVPLISPEAYSNESSVSNERRESGDLSLN